MNQRQRTSPWIWIGAGCGCLVLIVVLISAALFYFGFKTVQTFQEGIADPVKRTEKARQLLGTEELPEGYQAVMSFSLPLLAEFVMLADEPVDFEDRQAPPPENMFLYLELVRGGQNWRDYYEGRGDPLEILEGQGMQLRRDELIHRDSMQVKDQTIDYVAQRGAFRTDGREVADALITLLFIRCPEDRRMRLGVWIGRDPAPEQSVEQIDFTGTQADPQRIRELMSTLGVCGS